jgi:hypothetical protein
MATHRAVGLQVGARDVGEVTSNRALHFAHLREGRELNILKTGRV